MHIELIFFDCFDHAISSLVKHLGFEAFGPISHLINTRTIVPDEDFRDAAVRN